MENQPTCVVCQQPLILRPAGLSKKTGKPYSAFYACSDINHKQPYKGQPAGSTPIPQTTSSNQPNWDKIRETKTEDIRANVALKMVSEIIAGGQIKIEEWETWANIFYSYIPNAQDPFKVNIDKKADELLAKQDSVDLSKIKF